MKFLSSSKLLTTVQLLVVVLGVIGLFYFPITISSIMLTMFCYFLYGCIGVSVMMHRYWSHRSFEFKWPALKWIFTGMAVLSCRGSILGWVYIHRLHHKYSDTVKDPHAPSFKGWRIFFPYFLNYDESINKFIIKDFLNPIQLHIAKYFMLYIFLWIILLGSISVWLLYFAWILPVALTQLAVSSFLYFGHTKDMIINTSKDSILLSILFWGEGWHINHHKNPGRWSNSNKWWQIDMTSWVIRIIKK